MIQLTKNVQILPLYDTWGNVSTITGVIRFRGKPYLFSIKERRDSEYRILDGWRLQAASFLVPGPYKQFPTWRDAIAYMEGLAA